MTVHIWTVFRPRCEPMTGFGNLAYLAAWLDDRRLPGVAPVDWIIDILLNEEHVGRFSYVHDEAGPDECGLPNNRENAMSFQAISDARFPTSV